MTHPALIERITRSLAYMLRHQPEEFELELDAHGFGHLDEVVRALNERLGEAVEAVDVEAAIASGDRPRYEIADERVRALYGHSIDVEPGDTSKPPELLFVGLGSRDAKRAVQYGLRGGRRRFLHLALTIEDARETGRRAAREYSILTIHALDAWEDGVDFYDRQALFLAEQIPTDFLEITESRDDGEDRIEGGRGRSDRGRGRRDGGRGRDGGRHRSGGRGGRDREPAREERSDGRRAPAAREPARESRGPEPDRERRPERDRERRPERDARPAQGRDRPPERKPERKPEPARKPAPAKNGPSFGSGVLDEIPAKAPRREPAPPPPAPEPEPAHEPAAKPAVRETVDDSPGFGAGV